MLTPLGKRVLIEPKEAEETYKDSNIIIPETNKETPSEGTVVSVGKDVTQVTAGDKVMYGKYSGTLVEVEDKEHLIMYEDDIIAMI